MAIRPYIRFDFLAMKASCAGCPEIAIPKVSIRAEERQ
jgi:hypothetical protein